MSDPIVSVEQGQLKGSILKLQDNSTYYSFKGIRYADVPKRFMAPVPPKSWEGVYDATKHGPVCTQYDMMTQRKILGDENCLFLNVYTKSLDTKAKLPVMVFIHGGGYMSGSGNSDTLGPEYILQHDVILVTINYRLEVLGFLCLDTPEVPGNAGLKDQVAALRWVQDNIAQFGGDPNNVTIFGESAGGASVTFHMHSPMSKGLFNKALAQSGVSIHDWAQGTDGRERAIRTAKCLGMDSTDTSKILEFLRSVPAEELSRLTLTSMSEDEKRGGMNICYAPVVEKTFEGVQSFLTETSIDNLHSGQMNKVPLMLGYTSNEGLITFMFENKTEDLNNNPHYVVPKGIKSRVTEEKLKNIGQRIKILYAGDKGFTLDDPQLFADMLSDYYFNFSVQRFANLYHSLAPTYFYVFDCDTELNVVKNLLGFSQLKGACHADDLFYIFSNMLTKDAYNKNQKLKDIVYSVTKLWTNFAKTSNPTPDNSLGIKWEPYTRSTGLYLEIGDTLKPTRFADTSKLDFCNQLYSEAGLPY